MSVLEVRELYQQQQEMRLGIAETRQNQLQLNQDKENIGNQQQTRSLQRPKTVMKKQNAVVYTLTLDPNTMTGGKGPRPSFLMPRRSVIGRIERQASFQTQRLSDVGVAVGQQITAKMGLKLPASQERIVEQTRWLFLRYILVKLRQKSLPLRDLNLSKSLQARRAAALGQTVASSCATQSAPASAQAVSDFAPVAPSFKVQSINEDSQLPQQAQVPPPLSRLKSRAARESLKPADIQLFVSNSRLELKTNQLSNSTNPLSNSDYETTIHENSIGASSDNGFHRGDIRNPIPQRSDTRKLNPQRTSYNFGLLEHNISKININKSENKRNEGHRSFHAGDKPSELVESLPVPMLTPVSNRKFMMDPAINNQIFSVIVNIISELHDSKPELYDDTIYELIGIDKFASLQDLLEVQMTICQEMTRTEITWCRIIALFSLFGAMALDSVRLGNPENVGPILDGFIGFVERDLAYWISQQGGWESFLYTHRVGNHLLTNLLSALLISLPFGLWALISLFN